MDNNIKVLIYFEEEKLEHVGGPYGYLYNLKMELDKRNDTTIQFLKSSDTYLVKTLKKIKNKLPPILKKVYINYRNEKNRISYFTKALSSNEKIAKINFNEYDIVHFHTTMSLYMVKDSLKEYKGIVLLTTHTPKVPYKEIIEDKITKEQYEKNKQEYNLLEEVDKYAFERADYIIFPCKEAEEPYYNTWKEYKNIHEKNKGKIIYLPTAIPDINIPDTSKEIRKKYNIPENAFVISYIGRHNQVKGYDELKKIGEKILSKNRNIYFLVAGKEEPLKGLNDNHWIEVGWTNNPYEIVNSSNLFILPNKETYFDLVLLEVMSLGKPVVLTRTGGNKFFEKFTDTGLLFYDYGDVNSAINQIEKINLQNSLEYGKKNKELFLKEFEISIFVDRYFQIIEEVLNNNK